MPLYSYTCMKCNWQRSDIRTINERHEGPFCDRCNNRMILLIDPVRGFVKDPAVPRKP